ncbi:MAG: HAD hydrolase family protein, partial [SAR324 cluster bacterium]|nr:HAD hydrolase family protein [SAR324 cluster bacterium]
MTKIKNNISKKRIIFSDLDGSFLNEDNFAYGNNVKLVKKLLREDNFIVFNSSKTYIEIKEFLEDINIDLP